MVRGGRVLEQVAVERWQVALGTALARLRWQELRELVPRADPDLGLGLGSG